MDLTHIKEFCTVIDYGSITKAAEALYISQPSLSRHLSELEAELQSVLIVRTASKKIELTNAGRILYTEGKRLLEEMELLSNRIRAAGSGRQGDLCLQCGTAFVTSFFTDILYAFSCAYPDIALRCNTKGLTMTQHDALLSGKIDLALGYEYEYCEFVDKLNLTPVREESFYAVVSKYNPLAEQDCATIAELHQMSMIYVESPGNELMKQEPLDSVMSIFNDNRIPALSLDSMVLQSRSSNCFCVFPKTIAEHYAVGGKALPISDLKYRCVLVVATARQQSNSCVPVFLDFLRRQSPLTGLNLP